VALLALEDLGRNVVRRSAHGAFALIARAQLRREAEVAHADLKVPRQKEVAELEVAVDDKVRVQVAHGVEQLQRKVGRLGLGELLAPLHKLHEGLARTELEHDVDVRAVLEESVEADDVPVLQRAVDLDFGEQLLDQRGVKEKRAG
jgi:hypothetical protein